jgi:hypothetical protein
MTRCSCCGTAKHSPTTATCTGRPAASASNLGAGASAPAKPRVSLGSLLWAQQHTNENHVMCKHLTQSVGEYKPHSHLLHIQLRSRPCQHRHRALASYSVAAARTPTVSSNTSRASTLLIIRGTVPQQLSKTLPCSSFYRELGISMRVH